MRNQAYYLESVCRLVGRKKPSRVAKSYIFAEYRPFWYAPHGVMKFAHGEAVSIANTWANILMKKSNEVT